MNDPQDEVWMNIIRGILHVPAADRLSTVSRLMLSSNSQAASRLLSKLLANATNLVRINGMIADWIPQLIENREENPLCSVVPLDLTIRTARCVEAAKQAMEAGLYVRNVSVDIQVDMQTFQELKEAWAEYLNAQK